jgi:membrane protein implicated in regulation of membrane protease activity
LSAFSVDSAFGWGTLVAGLTGTPLCYLLGLRLVPYSPLSDRSTVGEPPAEAPEPLPEAVRPGARGRARTALRPMGTVMIADESIEAASSKGIIPAGTAVRVVDIRGRRVTVAPLAADDDGSAEKNPMDTPGDERAGPAD